MHFIQRNFLSQKLDFITHILKKNKPIHICKVLLPRSLKNWNGNTPRILRKKTESFLFTPLFFTFSFAYFKEDGVWTKYRKEKFYEKNSKYWCFSFKNFFEALGVKCFNIFKRTTILKFFLFALAIEITAINYPTNAIFDNLKDESLSSYQIKRIFYNNNKFTVSERIKESDDGKKYIKIKRNFTMKILKQNKMDFLQLREDNSTIKLRYNLSEKAWVFIGLIEDRFGVKDCLAIKISEKLNF